MTPAARERAMSLPLGPEETRLIQQALEGDSE
jgi:hypothetical protein